MTRSRQSSTDVRRGAGSGRALTLVVVAALAAPLVGAPSAQAAGEELTGTLVRAYVDVMHTGPGSSLRSAGPQRAGDDQLTWVRTASGARVRVPSAPLLDVAPGATVRVRLGAPTWSAVRARAGRQVLSRTVLAGPPSRPVRRVATRTAAAGTVTTSTGAPGTTAAAGTVAPAASTRVVHIVQVVPPGSSTPTDQPISTTASRLNGPVADYWAGQTDGAIRLVSGEQRSWAPITQTCDSPDPTPFFEQAAARTTAGSLDAIDAAGDLLMVELPYSTVGTCGPGLGYVGQSPLATGGAFYVAHPAWTIAAHEVGHNLGLAHANAADCGATVADRPAIGPTLTTTACRRQDYDDLYDVMGASWSGAGSLSAPRLDRLGLLPPEAQTTLSVASPPPSPTTVTLTALGARTGVRSLKVVDGARTYYVEYRGAVGEDSEFTDTGVFDDYRRGVVVRHDDGDGSFDAETWLLSPRGSASVPRYPLLPGQAVTTAAGDVTFSVTAMTATTATVEVATGAPPVTSVSASTSGVLYAGRRYVRAVPLAVSWTPSPSDPLLGFEVWVDGVRRVTTDVLGPTARSTTLPALTAGTHTVQVRAVDSPSRWVAGTAATVLVDAAAPAVSSPAVVYLRGGTVGSTVPVQTLFRFTDAVGVVSQSATSPRLATLTSTATVWDSAVAPGSWSFRVQAADRAGNTSATAASRTVRLGPETWGATYSSGWSTLRSSAYLNGAARATSTAGRSVSYRVSSRGVALVASRGPNRGKASVYVDGRLAATLDLRSSTYVNRQLVWRQHWSAVGTHTVKVVAQGTAGRPWVVLDGLATIS